MAAICTRYINRTGVYVSVYDCVCGYKYNLSECMSLEIQLIEMIDHNMRMATEPNKYQILLKKSTIFDGIQMKPENIDTGLKMTTKRHSCPFSYH
ncbi:hypothetical protein SK128_027794 [Halocaridina rubra]|uniref:Uncharacterized protein n=1 Tax=Halocaridina rubra TaxID=373956 RepID=A0AAN8WVV6_HALRR